MNESEIDLDNLPLAEALSFADEGSTTGGLLTHAALKTLAAGCRELTAARAEIERLDTAGIHSCHKDCQRPNCVLRRERDELATCLASEKITRNHIVELASETERELTAVTEQRDELLRYNEAFRKETLICADCDSIRKEEYDQAIEQRDRLAEAMWQMWPFIEEDDYPNCNTPEFNAAILKYKEALQPLTTNEQ